MQSRVHSALTTVKIDAAVQKLNESESDQFKVTFADIEKVSRDFAVGHSYEHNPYLVYIATKLFLTDQAILPF